MAKSTIYGSLNSAQVNTFGGGMNKDLHPMIQPSDTYTDCLNGTMITYQGNEYMMQNDMGNYELENAKLPEGYIPLGMKEYQGILYIVSYNPETKRTQIGTYPSPKSLTYIGDELTNDIKPMEIGKIDKFPECGEITDATFLEICEQIFSKDPDDNFKQYSATALEQENKAAVFSVNFDDDSKLTLNDKFKLIYTDDVRNNDVHLQSLKFSIIGEDKSSENVTDKIEYTTVDIVDTDEINEPVTWDKPGWLSAKYELDSVNGFEQHINVNRSAIDRCIIESIGEYKEVMHEDENSGNIEASSVLSNVKFSDGWNIDINYIFDNILTFENSKDNEIWTIQETSGAIVPALHNYSDSDGIGSYAICNNRYPEGTIDISGVYSLFISEWDTECSIDGTKENSRCKLQIDPESNTSSLARQQLHSSWFGGLDANLVVCNKVIISCDTAFSDSSTSLGEPFINKNLDDLNKNGFPNFNEEKVTIYIDANIAGVKKLDELFKNKMEEITSTTEENKIAYGGILQPDFINDGTLFLKYKSSSKVVTKFNNYSDIESISYSGNIFRYRFTNNSMCPILRMGDVLSKSKFVFIPEAFIRSSAILSDYVLNDVTPDKDLDECDEVFNFIRLYADDSNIGVRLYSNPDSNPENNGYSEIYKWSTNPFINYPDKLRIIHDVRIESSLGYLYQKYAVCNPIINGLPDLNQNPDNYYPENSGSISAFFNINISRSKNSENAFDISLSWTSDRAINGIYQYPTGSLSFLNKEIYFDIFAFKIIDNDIVGVIIPEKQLTFLNRDIVIKGNGTVLESKGDTKDVIYETEDGGTIKITIPNEEDPPILNGVKLENIFNYDKWNPSIGNFTIKKDSNNNESIKISKETIRSAAISLFGTWEIDRNSITQKEPGNACANITRKYTNETTIRVNLELKKDALEKGRDYVVTRVPKMNNDNKLVNKYYLHNYGETQLTLSTSGLNSLTIESMPILKCQNKLLFHDSKIQTDVIYPNINYSNNSNVVKYKYNIQQNNSSTMMTVSIYLEMSNAVDWDAIVDSIILYRLSNGNLEPISVVKASHDARSISDVVTINLLTDYYSKEDLPFFFVKIPGIFTGVLVNGVMFDGSKYTFGNKELLLDNFMLDPAIQVELKQSYNIPGLSASLDGASICYIYCKAIGDNPDFSNVEVSMTPITPTFEKVRNKCFFGIGLAKNLTIKADNLRGCTWTVDDRSIVKMTGKSGQKMKIGRSATVITQYYLRECIPVCEENKGKIKYWRTREYLIKNGYAPLTMWSDDENCPDKYNLTELSSYAKFINNANNDGVFLNIAKASGHNSAVHIAVSDLVKNDGSSNLNVSDLGPVYEYDISGINSYLPKDQLFYFTQFRVCTKDNGITTPFPMYPKENFFWKSKDHPRHSSSTGSVEALVGTRRSYWLAEKSFLGQYKERAQKGIEIYSKQIGATMAMAAVSTILVAGIVYTGMLVSLAIAAGAIMAAGGLIGVIVVAVVVLVAAICAGIKWLLGLNANDRYFNAILLRNSDDSRGNNYSLFTVPIWGSRIRFPSYVFNSGDTVVPNGRTQIDDAEMRMVLAMKRLYYNSSDSVNWLGDNQTTGWKMADNDIDETQSDNTINDERLKIKISSASGLPLEYEGISFEDIKAFVNDYTGIECKNFNVSSSYETTQGVRFYDAEKIDPISYNEYFNNIQEYLNEIVDNNNPEKFNEYSLKKIYVDTDGLNVESIFGSQNDSIQEEINKIKDALQQFADNLIVENGVVRFNPQPDRVLQNCANCIGGNSGSNWITLHKETDKRYIHDDYLKVMGGERPRAAFTVIANPILPGAHKMVEENGKKVKKDLLGLILDGASVTPSGNRAGIWDCDVLGRSQHNTVLSFDDLLKIVRSTPKMLKLKAKLS